MIGSVEYLILLGYENLLLVLMQANSLTGATLHNVVTVG
jgi:hypothetical protein